jgi:hypothetical protein
LTDEHVTDDRLTGQQQGALGRLTAARGEHPSAEVLLDYDELAPPDRERHAAHDHIVICSRCQLVLLHAAEPVQKPSSIRWVLPIAALLVRGLTLTLVNRRGGSSDPPLETIRGTEILPTSPIGSLDLVTEFAWQSPIRAERYRVTVNRGSELVWQGETNALRLAAPAGVFESNVEYRWSVEAIDREGDVRMTSPSQVFKTK